MPNPAMMKFFEFAHLPEKLQTVSKPIGEVAKQMEEALTDSAEKTAGLRKLLEAKDCFVRAALPVVVLLALSLCAAPAEAGLFNFFRTARNVQSACANGQCGVKAVKPMPLPKASGTKAVKPLAPKPLLVK